MYANTKTKFIISNEALDLEMIVLIIAVAS